MRYASRATGLPYLIYSVICVLPFFIYLIYNSSKLSLITRFRFFLLQLLLTLALNSLASINSIRYYQTHTSFGFLSSSLCSCQGARRLCRLQGFSPHCFIRHWRRSAATSFRASIHNSRSFASFDAQLLLCSLFLRTASSATGGAVLRNPENDTFLKRTVILSIIFNLMSYITCFCSAYFASLLHDRPWD